MLTMADKSGVKWSRNLREESVTENNRVKLMQRQKMLLESKLQRQPQVVATVSRLPKSPSAASYGSSRSSEHLLPGEGELQQQQRGKSARTSSFSTDKGGRDTIRGIDNLSVSAEKMIMEEEEVGGDNGQQNSGKPGIIDPNSGRRRKSTASGTRSGDSEDSVSSGEAVDEDEEDDEDSTGSPSRSPSSSSHQASAASRGRGNKGRSGVLSSSPESEASGGGDLKGKPTPGSSLGKGAKSGRRMDSAGTTDLADRKQQQHVTTTATPAAPPNPLTMILTNTELLQFVSQPLSPSQVFQCTIMRDKRGIDRSLYPSYFMYLQTVVDVTQEKNGDEDENRDEDKRKSDSATKQDKRSPGESSSATASSVPSNRQVFLLCGRRRKKSKTYLIGLDPFDISRQNSIAKLKSNILGTEFRCSRMNRSGHRFEDVSVIYDANVLGFKGPRKMTILIPKPFEKPMVYPLIDLWTKQRNKGILQLKNKTPVWNEDSQSYVLNFHGRVTQASVKNFQLVPDDSASESSYDHRHLLHHHHHHDPSSSSPSRSEEFNIWDLGSSPLSVLSSPSSPKEKASTKILQKDSKFTLQQQQQQMNKGGGGGGMGNKKDQTTSSEDKSPITLPVSSTPYTSNKDEMKPLDIEVCMQFGRVSDKEFTCDITHPLSPLQAFAIALSSFDSKLGVE